MMLLAGLAWAADPTRWLERTDAPEVVAWAEARDAEARAWIAAGGKVDGLREWAEPVRKGEPEGRTFLDLSGGTRVDRSWRREDPAPEASARVEGSSVSPATPPPKPIVHTWLVVTREGTERTLAGDLDDTHRLCGTALARAGRYVAWGRQLDGETAPCRMYVTDLADGRTWTAFEAVEPSVTFAPDASRFLVSHVVDGTGRITEYTLDGSRVAERLRNPHRLTAQWLPDGHVFVRTGSPADTPFPGPVYGNRLAWGTPERLDWLGDALFWPPWGRYSLAGQDGDRLLLRTDVDAPGYRVVRVDPAEPWRRRWETVVPEDPSSPLTDARLVGDALLLVRAHDGANELFARTLDAAEVRPLGVRASGSLAVAGRGDTAVVSAWSVDGTWRYAVAPDGTVEPIEARPKALTFETLHVVSADGTDVPVSVVRPAEPMPDAPVWMRVYGGFGVNETAYSDWTVQRWLELGGVFAWVHARGGGERGEAWHDAAKRANKPRTIDDVVAAAEWFATHGSRPGRIVLSGASNGGLTVAATVARRPDLFGAAVAQSGVYDLVRGPRMGRWWPDEYGRPSGPKADRDTLRALSPLLATPPGPLPPIFLVTGREDPRVTPAHSFKLAAAWSELPGGPVLLRVTPWTSHGEPGDNADVTPDAWTDEWAEEFAFVLRALGM